MSPGSWLLAAALSALLWASARGWWLRHGALLAAERALRRGRPESAVFWLERLHGRRPKDPTLAHRLAQAYYQAGRPAVALDLCDELLKGAEDAARGPLQALRADCLERLGRPDEAASARDAAGEAFLSRDAGSLFARELAVDRLQAEGDWFGALRELENLLDSLTSSPQTPSDPTSFAHFLAALRVRLAKLYSTLGHDQSAVTTLELVLGRGGLPESIRHDAHLAAARAYLALGSIEQAQRDAQDAFRIANLAHEPERLIDDCLLLGEVAVHRGDYVEAMHQYQRVRECGENGRWLAYLSEAQLLHLWGRRSEAERAGRRAAELAPRDPITGAVVALARAAMAYDDDPRAARALLEPALDAPSPEPRFGVRRSALAAMTAAALGDDPSPWLDDIAAARRTFGHDHLLLADLDDAEGEIAWHRGDYSSAVLHFQAAILRPCQALLAPQIQLRLADCMARLGADGTPWLRRAADFGVPLAAVEAAQRRLSGATS